MSRARNLFVFVALIAAGATLAACGGDSGGDDDPQAVLDNATLKGIESGNVDLSLEVGIEGKTAGNVDVALSGPFQTEENADLPELGLSLSIDGVLDGEKVDREGGLTLLGGKAWVGYEGTEYEVDATTLNFAKSTFMGRSGNKSGEEGSSGCQEAAAALEPGDFLDNVKAEGSADVGGTSTEKISGDLDVSGAMDALTELSEDPACSAQLDASGAFPSPAELEQAKDTVEDSIKSGEVVLYVGDDDIVRRVVAELTIEPPKSARASAKRVGVDLDLTLTGVNEDQTISTPSKPKPLSDLFIKLGINPIELLDAFQNGGGIQGLGNLFGGLGGLGGKQSYADCIGKADTPVDIQNCGALLQ